MELRQIDIHVYVYVPKKGRSMYLNNSGLKKQTDPSYPDNSPLPSLTFLSGLLYLICTQLQTLSQRTCLEHENHTSSCARKLDGWTNTISSFYSCTYTWSCIRIFIACVYSRGPHSRDSSWRLWTAWSYWHLAEHRRGLPSRNRMSTHWFANFPLCRWHYAAYKFLCGVYPQN